MPFDAIWNEPMPWEHSPHYDPKLDMATVLGIRRYERTLCERTSLAIKALSDKASYAGFGSGFTE